MKKITGIAEAVLYSADIQTATEFYTTILKLPLIYSFGDSRFLQTGEHSTLILFDRSYLKSRKSIIPAHGTDGPGHVAIAIPQATYDEWKGDLIAAGVEIEHEQVWSQGTRSIYFRDPDNNSIELIEDDHYPMVWERYLAKRAAGQAPS